MTLTLPEIEVSIAKLEKVWREVGGSTDHTWDNIDEDVMRAFAAKHHVDVCSAAMDSLNQYWCSLQITKGDNQMTIALWSPITEKSNKQKAPVGAEA